MKIRFIKEKDPLWYKFWEIYNVFCITIWDNWKKFYIDRDWNSFIYPIDIKDCEIIDNSLSKYWFFWINKFWEYVIWPKEIYLSSNFWDDYYNWIENSKSIINFYFKLAKNDLFNE